VSSLQGVRRYIAEYGVMWTLLYAMRRVVLGGVTVLDGWLINIERHRVIAGPESISSRYHTIAENRETWDTWDWSAEGEEWTDDARMYLGVDPSTWKATVVERLIDSVIPPGSVVVEIGPGAGRWTKHLLPHASRLILADISAACLDMCRHRFGDDGSVEYRLIEDCTLPFIPDDSIDVIWSYEVFVHINPSDTATYVGEFARVLRPGGRVIVHHSGTYSDAKAAKLAYRSAVSAELFARLARDNHLVLVDQDTDTPHFRGDVVTTLAKPL
jgi:SAM-dependent methyltransferase